MEYKKFNNVIVLRIDKDEDILEKIKELSLKENIKLASVNGLGAVDNFTVGVYKVDERKYFSNEFFGTYEIVSLSGTINTMDKEHYAHLHMSCSDELGKVVGGHLNKANVSATCEIVINIIDGEVDRTKDETIGLNLFDFNK